MATNPPITIGELATVPAPGSGVTSAWAQQVSNRIVHRFATVAERDTKWPAATAGRGAMCVTNDPEVLWRVILIGSTPTWIGDTVINATYTPVLTGMGVGNGLNTAEYTFVGSPAGGILNVDGKLQFGAAGSVFPATAIGAGLPPGIAMLTNVADVNNDFDSIVTYYDVSAPAFAKGWCRPNGSTAVRLVVTNIVGSYISTGGTGPSTPWVWAAGDVIFYRYNIRAYIP